MTEYDKIKPSPLGEGTIRVLVVKKAVNLSLERGSGDAERDYNKANYCFYNSPLLDYYLFPKRQLAARIGPGRLTIS